MRTPSAKYDRRITFRAQSSTRDADFNTRDKSWADYQTVWAQVLDMLPSRGEQIADGVDIRKKPCRVRIRYRSDVGAQMRVVIGGETYTIVGGPVMVGRQDELEMVCELLSTQGDGP